MITKDLIFYFVRKTIDGFTSEQRERLKGVKIFVYDNILVFDPHQDKKEIIGSWTGKYSMIEYYLPTLLNFIGPQKDVYEAIKKVESVVEHELLHAIGLNHEQIDKLREKRKKLNKNK